jgi:hypothetical protein
MVHAAVNQAAMKNFTAGLDMLDKARAAAAEMGASYVSANAAIARAGVFLARRAEQDLERALDAAAAAADEAREASLTGAQAMALSRHAEALRRRGAGQRALVMARSALRILDRKRNIEGSEEELLYNSYLAMQDAADPGAEAILKRARASYEAKLSRLERDEWRESFQEIPLHRAILAATSS